MEEWRQIIDYPDYYISNLGNIKSFKRGKEKILKQSNGKDGYFVITIGINKKQFRVHRLIAKHFLEDYSEDLFVDHIDRNRINNNIKNLRMVTNSMNSRNRSKRLYLTSKFKGVCFHKIRNKWIASIARKHLGYFEKEEDAAKAYNDYIVNNNLECYVLNEF